MSDFLKNVLEYRSKEKKKCHDRMQELLPKNINCAFQYVTGLQHSYKPDYNLVKLFLSSDITEERKIY